MSWPNAVPLDRVDLGADGISRVSSALSDGLTLARLVLEGTDLSAGRAYAMVPRGIPRPRLLRWDEGGLMSSDQGLKAVSAELRPLLQGPHSVLVAEDALASASDPVIQKQSGGCFTYSKEVYEYGVAPADRDGIESCLRMADAGYTLNAVVAQGVEPPANPEDERYLRRIAEGTRLVVTRAYDGEGFVLWRPAHGREGR